MGVGTGLYMYVVVVVLYCVLQCVVCMIA